ncbi:alpha/beta hydrolase [Amycolatopsis tucumanensis]|uniref:Alpha/beta hydrolase n=1 Tax=Amycolatopsis tucumanensis TaxID=401106 RepID=A0ABP7JAA2_9PSEU|nr:alpha/beta hydrolase [Amycolatopsis tucumanensis]MCF6421800.1 alpha/beta hydrolase [Amycolatopsis tucumanensis]
MTDGTRNLVLVHGAWHGPWCWELFVPELESRGWAVSAVDLPSTWGDPAAGMRDDARAVRDHLAAIDGPVTVLAHSYGGVPATEAAGPAVERIIYLAAHMLAEGESVITPLGGPWFPADADFAPGPDPEQALYPDVPDDWTRKAVGLLRPQSAKAFTEELTRASWRTIPSALVVCDDDLSLPGLFVDRAIAQGMADVVRHLPGGHSPFLSRPAELAELVGEVTAALPVVG